MHFIWLESNSSLSCDDKRKRKTWLGSLWYFYYIAQGCWLLLLGSWKVSFSNATEISEDLLMPSWFKTLWYLSLSDWTKTVISLIPRSSIHSESTPNPPIILPYCMIGLIVDYMAYKTKCVACMSNSLHQLIKKFLKWEFEIFFYCVKLCHNSSESNDYDTCDKCQLEVNFQHLHFILFRENKFQFFYR